MKTVVSLFDGMSCTQLALKKIGIIPEQYFASEIDKKAMEVTKFNFPNTIQLGSVENFNNWNLPEKIDLMVCGFPCQDLSFAGKKAGLQGERSGLFYKAVNALIKFRPKYFLFENTKMKKSEMDIISNILGVQPILINSSKLIPQNRERLYWSNIPNIKQPEQQTTVILDDLLQDGFKSDRKIARCLTANFHRVNVQHYFIRKRGNMVMLRNEIRNLTPIECERLQGVPDDYTKCVANTHRFKMLGNGFTIPVVSYILKNIKNQKK